MKTANKIFYSVVLAKLFAIGLVVFAATSQTKLNTQINSAHELAKTAAIEQTSATPIQIVLISTKHLGVKEKLAMDLKPVRTLQANTQFNKKMRKIA